MKINPLHAVDSYKLGHRDQYPAGTTLVYSNLTPRSDKLSSIPVHLFTGKVTFFGLQFFILDYLVDAWEQGFFDRPKEEVVAAYKRRVDGILGDGVVKTDHIEALHDLGYLPICIKALPEGAQVPIKVPCLVIYNTHPDFFWLTNYLETALSAYVWKPTTTATIANHYRLLLQSYAEKTGADPAFVDVQGHDFAARGMSGMYDAAISGVGHLTSFIGSDNVASVDVAEEFYFANPRSGPTAVSVPATEHSVMCMGGSENELDTFRRLITEIYPTGIVSIVSDTWDFWRTITEFATLLKPEIMAREGKVVYRPDSGDPVKIICGSEFRHYTSFEEAKRGERTYAWIRFEQDRDRNLDHREAEYTQKVFINNSAYILVFHVHLADDVIKAEYLGSDVYFRTPEDRGAVECLWDVFGGTVNEKGYKVLSEKVGLIYGDSITLARAEAILKGLEAKGFASSNIVFGIGSFTYQHVTRDTFGFAVKSTFGAVDGVGREIFKDPKTDGGTKKSARGLISVQVEGGEYVLRDQQPSIDMEGCRLSTVYHNGQITGPQTLDDIRKRVRGFWPLEVKTSPKEKRVDFYRIAVQVMGNYVSSISIPAMADVQMIEDTARGCPLTASLLEGKRIAKVIIHPEKLINFVTTEK